MWLKLFFITILLAVCLLSLIIVMDYWTGLAHQDDFIWKAINPFRVMEPAEYIIILFFIFIFIKNSILSFIKRKKQKSSN